MNAKVKYKHTVLSPHVGWIKNVRQILKDNCFVEIVWTKHFMGFLHASKLKKYKNIHGYNIKFRKNWLHPSLCFTRFSRNEKIIWVCEEKCSKPIFSLITANETLFNGRGPIEEFLSSDVITPIKPPLCLGIPELCNEIHCTCIFLVTIIFFFLDLTFRLVKLALNSQHVLHGQIASTQEFQAFTPQERNSIICWLGVTE